MPAGHVDCGQVREAHIVLGGGRELAYADLGRPGGPCVFFFHGAPMSRLHLVPLEEQFAARGLRVISPDRPGYGRSSPQPGRSLSDWPADVTGLADALGLDRFLVAGHSSGGAYALACAALREAVRDDSADHPEQDPALSRARLMNGAGDELLARPAAQD